MVDIRFYQLQKSPLEKSLPRLLEKVYATGSRAVLLVESEERLQDLDLRLWTYATQAFLPHGSARDGFAEDQPLWLTTTLENPNQASILVVTSGQYIQNFFSFEKCLDLFNGYDEDAVIQARQRWKAYQRDGHEITYWFQDEQEKWHKKETGKLE